MYSFAAARASFQVHQHVGAADRRLVLGQVQQGRVRLERVVVALLHDRESGLVRPKHTRRTRRLPKRFELGPRHSSSPMRRFVVTEHVGLHEHQARPRLGGHRTVVRRHAHHRRVLERLLRCLVAPRREPDVPLQIAEFGLKR